MSLELRLSAWRVYIVALWVGYMAWVSYFWLGLAGIGLVCVCSTRLVRRQIYRLTRVTTRVHLQDDDIKGVWQLGSLLCIHTYQASYWVFPGELLPGQRAALGAYLLAHVSRQAVGLRISS